MKNETVISGLGAFEGQEVVLRGWVCGKRSGGKIAFLLLRDGTGVCQCVAEAANADVFAAAGGAALESSVEVSGIARSDARSPGGRELALTSLRTIGASADYPVTRKAHGVDFLMSHRHLWLRSQRQTAILRIRHTLVKECRAFFDEQDFTLVDTPILTPGAGEDAQTLFPVEFYGDRVFLSQTGQLYLESACMALRKVYCFGPTFRAEKSKTRRHLSEFWMIEPEIAFAGLAEVMDLAEGLVSRLVKSVLECNMADLEIIGRDIEPLRRVVPPFARITYTEAGELLRSAATGERLESELAADRKRLQEMTDLLPGLEKELREAKKEAAKDRIQERIHELRESIRELEAEVSARPDHIRRAREFSWGGDLGGSDETIVSRSFDKPVFVTHYPGEAKAFYMKASGDGKTVLNMDLLAPEGYGEIIGGSQREDDLDALLGRMKECGLDPAAYSWYLDLRRYGSVPHGGFGLGIERTLCWICGLKHVREAIPFARMMSRMDM